MRLTGCDTRHIGSLLHRGYILVTTQAIYEAEGRRLADTAQQMEDIRIQAYKAIEYENYQDKPAREWPLQAKKLTGKSPRGRARPGEAARGPPAGEAGIKTITTERQTGIMEKSRYPILFPKCF